MAHEKRVDYEVAEVEDDLWVCDFCEREVTDEDSIHTFAVDPKVRFNHKKADDRLVWLNEKEGHRAVKQGTTITSDRHGHICQACVDDTSLSVRRKFGGVVVACLRKLRLR